MGADGVCSPGSCVAAEPSGATSFEAFEDYFGIVFQPEAAADGQVVERQVWGVGVAWVVAVQSLFDLSQKAAVEGDATHVALEQRLHFWREHRGIVGKEVCVFALPLMAVGLG